MIIEFYNILTKKSFHTDVKDCYVNAALTANISVYEALYDHKACGVKGSDYCRAKCKLINDALDTRNTTLIYDNAINYYIEEAY